MKRKKTEYYVNNKEFLAAITVYREQVHAAEEAGEPRPRVTNYWGLVFKDRNTPVIQTKLRKLYV